MHRALSWLERAITADADVDIAFICLWISFNAAYAKEIGINLVTSTTKNEIADFLDMVCAHDFDSLLAGLVWEEFAGPIRVLLDNPYVFQPFWDAQSRSDNDGLVSKFWKEDFEKSHRKVITALERQDTSKVLFQVFVRLYTLRNQIMHGGATWNSSVNRDQVRDGCAILSKVLPAIFSVMMSNPGHFAADPIYPVMSPK